MNVIVDYGIGNVASVQNMLRRRGIPVEISGDHAVIADAERIILPGIGAFDAAMIRLKETKLLSVIQEFAASGKPTMGICLGAQLFMESSMEGVERGLGILAGKCVRFNFADPNLKIPHMGWSDIDISIQHPVLDFSKLDNKPRFYFAHSYHFDTTHRGSVAATTDYGYRFPSILIEGNVIAAQCHPEKSHTFGMQLLENFAHWQHAKS